MKTIENQVEHCWKPMEEYKPKIDGTDATFDVIDFVEEPCRVDMDSLRKMKPNQFYSINGCILNSGINEKINKETDLKNTNKFHKYIKFLKENGFDIDKNVSSQYGYRMPIPKKGDSERRLIIFRRY